MPDERPCPVTNIRVDAQASQGPLDLWRHTLGHGGINALPLPEGVIEGVRRLQPRLIRIFIQEFFRIYPKHDRFDWSRLDPYMDTLARSGAKVVAAITIKPKPLYPTIDPSVWRPNNIQEWQHVIAEMVRRYSIERPIVTHWEIGNEPDIGEDGGCPYLIRDGEAYGEYYAMTIHPILATFQQAKVGGPAMAVMHNQPLPGFLKYCKRTGARLDFISWHLYHSDPGRHAFLAEVAGILCDELLGRRPEFLVTEWNRRLGGATQDDACNPRRAAAVAAAVLDMRRVGLDWSFYYHIWDQTCFAEDFEGFFSPPGVANMLRHWNEIPHRLGLFGVDGQVRPQYFVYQMLGRLGDERLAASCDDRDVRVLAGRSGSAVNLLAVNYSLDEAADRVLTLRVANLAPGPKHLAVYRVDGRQSWCPQTLALHPVEQRDTYASREFLCQLRLPADSVALIRLANLEPAGS